MSLHRLRHDRSHGGFTGPIESHEEIFACASQPDAEPVRVQATGV